MPTDKLVADFIADTPAERDDELTKALSVATLKAEAEGNVGILVTRHNFRRFSVSLSPAVPHGFIHERDHVQRCFQES